MPHYNRTLVFIASCAGIFLFGISLITLGSIMPQLAADFMLSELDKGLLASLLPAGILAGSLVFGPVVDKYAYKYLLAVSVILIMTGLLVIAWSGSFFLLGLSFLLIGSGGGAINGATSSLVSDFSEDHGENKGSNLSMMGVFFGLGALGMPLLISLLSSWLHYRTIIQWVGLFMIFPLLFLALIQYPHPKQAHEMSLQGIGKLLKTGSLILLSMILFFQSGWESLLNNWTTTFLMGVKNLSGSHALNYLTLFVAVFTLGRFMVGLLLKKYSGRSILLFSAVVAISGNLLLIFEGNDYILALAVLLSGLGLASAFPVVLGIIGDQFARWSGTAFGIALTIALTGNILINYLTGVVTESYGLGSFTWVLLITGSGTIFMIFIGLFKNNG